MKWQDKEYEKPTGCCIIGGYTLDLYCANPINIHAYQTHADSYGGNNWMEAVIQARRAGWRLDFKKDLAICPSCASKEKQK